MTPVEKPATVEKLAAHLVTWIGERVAAGGGEGVVFGLSGGVDSAVVAALSQRAFPHQCLGLIMPCHSEPQDEEDAHLVAHHFGIATARVDLGDVYDGLVNELGLTCTDTPASRLACANIKPRLRMTSLYAFANLHNYRVLGTGNRSELAVGYCTLYGDMNGGLAVIADLPKMMVYRVSRWRNRRRPDIPEAILSKAPSAELRPDQTDQDSLPPYALLDLILELHVEQCQSAEEIIAQGFDEATVRRVLRLVRIAEFKRKQAALVLKVTSRAFGTGWRMPIVRQE